MLQPSDIQWQHARFEALSLQQLYALLQLRAEVFILEQGPYQDLDGLDQHSVHLMGCAPDGRMLAYLRIVEAGHKYEEPSIGRVVCALATRGTGLGRELVRRGVALCDALYPGQANRISAQAHLQAFYRGFGYEPCSEIYSEDNIPHIKMLRPAGPSIPSP
ncbi:GNAT family N-acetyltransferase [Ideonella paludis]|uniref:GNAT family N-acetyltransferase n=1 Tax=Ideonella paludis TaxID=1233411 RepID=A0ABS5E1V8_9BURK|nr:GNAT family N-acetyltransferase [Ideonella paludis]MBQ0937304.1 GNAT family N-acetyltransferase [Ideonella paludis]